MIETVIAFVAGVMLTWPALITLMVLGVLAEHSGSRATAVFLGVVSAVVAYFFFNVSLVSIAIGAVCYIAIGLVWSFWRYKRHAERVVEENMHASPHEREYALQDLHPRNMLSTITAWILIWPFSLVENFVGDIINAIQALVQKVFRGVYHRIYDSAVAALK